ncbi:MAG: flagellar hook-basal body complex protein [Candidatus Zixiibacteriota bacterium]
MSFKIVNNTQAAISRNMRRMEMTANNLSNTETPGFKKLKAAYEKKNQEINMQSYRENTSGAIEKDGDPYHVAVLGDGYLRVQDNNGMFLRRAGDFAVSPEGELITSTGETVLVDGGAIQINGMPEITGDGTIIVNGEAVGRLDITVPTEPNRLQPARNGNFIYDGPEEEPQDTRLIQGALESSNSDGVEEMNSLIELTRSAEIASKIFRTSSEMLRMASTELGKVD